MKALFRLRWLETEIPVPGTADVSAKVWFAPVFVRETPGERETAALESGRPAQVWPS